MTSKEKVDALEGVIRAGSRPECGCGSDWADRDRVPELRPA